MKILLLGALVGSMILNATPTEQDLIIACKKGALKDVKKLLSVNVPVKQTTLEAAIESGSPIIADLILERNPSLFIAKSWFITYCHTPDKIEMARWLLDHGTGRPYTDHFNPLPKNASIYETEEIDELSSNSQEK